VGAQEPGSGNRPRWHWVAIGLGALVVISAISAALSPPETTSAPDQPAPASLVSASAEVDDSHDADANADSGREGRSGSEASPAATPGSTAPSSTDTASDSDTAAVPSTAAPTITAAPTTAAAPTTEALTTTEAVLDPVGSGMYVAGELEPGTYRVGGYWARLGANGDIIDNALTSNGGLTILHVDGTEDIVEINGEAVPLAELPVVDPIALGLTDGVYLVGIDVAPGRYRVTSDGLSYAARLDSNLGIIDNALSEGSVVITIAPSDYAVEISGSLELLP